MNLDVEVTSPARKAKYLGDTAAAVTVLTGEEIRRSGAVHLSDALRLVPGLSVARINSSSWAVSSRGFNQRFAEKLLVMIDGQSIYTPLFGGTFWEHQEMNLDDIERIEVIRGPGASVWGANAVNGVINIITKSAQKTLGSYSSMASGKETVLATNLRYGDEMSPETAYRVGGTFSHSGSGKLPNGEDAEDQWFSGSGEFRIDSRVDDNNSVTVKSRGYHIDTFYRTSIPVLSPPFFDTNTYSGTRAVDGALASVLWDHTLSADSKLNTKLDYLYEHDSGPILPQEVHITSLETQHEVTVSRYQEFLYGVGYRYYHDATHGNYLESFEPASSDDSLASAYAQSETRVIPDLLSLIVGSKFEYNQSTPVGIMPSARLLYTPQKNHTLWLAVSRALRNPTRTYESVRLPLAVSPSDSSPILALMTGNRQVRSESLHAFELGYRSDLTKRLFIDLAAFYNQYDHLNSLEPQEAFLGSPPYSNDSAVIVPLHFENRLGASSYGLEASLKVQPLEPVHISATYSFLDVSTKQGDSLDFAQPLLYRSNSPRNQATLHTSIDISDKTALNSVLRAVGPLGFGEVPGYFEMDLKLAFKLSKQLEIALVGQNLLNGSHLENVTPIFGLPRTEIERDIFGMVTVRF